MALNTVVLSFLTGLAVGAIFRLAKLPIPAPNTLEGVMGVFGLFAGYVLLNYVMRLLGV